MYLGTKVYKQGTGFSLITEGVYQIGEIYLHPHWYYLTVNEFMHIYVPCLKKFRPSEIAHSDQWYIPAQKRHKLIRDRTAVAMCVKKFEISLFLPDFSTSPYTFRPTFSSYHLLGCWVDKSPSVGSWFVEMFTKISNCDYLYGFLTSPYIFLSATSTFYPRVLCYS